MCYNSNTMALFGAQSKKGFLGVDVGAGGIKLAEIVTEKGQAKLVTYGYSSRKPTEITGPLLENQKVAADLLAKIYKKSGAQTKQAVSALPVSKVFSAVISVPKVKDEKELKPLIEAQARKLVPLPFEEMILDSKLIDPLKKVGKGEKVKGAAKAQKDSLTPIPEPKKQERVRVLITGAAKTLVQKYVQIFKSAGLELVALETESFGLIRSLVGKDKSSILIIDIGATRTNLTVVEKGIPFLTRSVNIGGQIVTKKIAEMMSVSEVEAEQIKHDLASQARGDDPLPVVEQTFTPILNEIQYTTEQYARMDVTVGKQIEKIILTGGSAHLPNLDKYIADKTNTNTYSGDPWARVAVPEDLRPVLEEIGPRFAVPVGLAMRDNE